MSTSWSVAPRARRRGLRAALPACGIAYGVRYVIADDVIAAAVWDGTRFRWFSILMAVTVLAAGALVGTTTSAVAAGAATPRMGLVERISYGAWLLWTAVLAIVLLRRTDEGRTG